MKQLFLISGSLMLSSLAFAQSECTSNSSSTLFKFDNAGTAREVRKLGTAPEFPFLRNKATADEFVAALHKADRNNAGAMGHLNDLLMAVGFANGAKDVTAANVTAFYVQPGTEGNMGSAGYTNGYYRLEGDASEFKAWKIATGTGSCAMYVFNKCGNAFYPKKAERTACIKAPVTINSGSQEVTLNSDGQITISTDNTYIYYGSKRRKRHENNDVLPGVATNYHSAPFLLRTTNDVQTTQETYKLSLTTPETTVSVCPDSTLILTANVNVEKTSEFTGNYPNKDKKEYKRVSKHVYKKTARKMRKVERKERQVTRITGETTTV